MSALYLTSDLIFFSRLAGVADRRGWRLETVSDVESLLASAAAEPRRLIILDLGMAGLDPIDLVARLRRLPSPPSAVIAYASHVHESLLAAAHQAGCDQVLSRGQLHAQAERILERYLDDSTLRPAES
jgi:CheY-like chemotaxis protein